MAEKSQVSVQRMEWLIKSAAEVAHGTRQIVRKLQRKVFTTVTTRPRNCLLKMVVVVLMSRSEME